MPVKKNISKDELYKLYIEENMSLIDVAKHFGASEATVIRNLKSFGIKKSNDKKQENREKVFVEKYGHTFQGFITSEKRKEIAAKAWSDEAREKRIQTNLSRYGCANASSSSIIQDKIKRTNLDKYGAEYVISLDEIQEKIKRTNIEKYGCENPFGNSEIQSKIKQTNLERYGAENPMQNKDVLNKTLKHFNDVFGGNSPMCSQNIRDKKDKTCLEKYGVKNVSSSDVVAAKRQDTFIKRYGVKNVGQSKVFQKKARLAIALKYKRLNFSQVSISDETLKIIGDRESLRNYIIENNFNKVISIAKSLGVSQTTIIKYLHKYDSWDLIKNSSSYGEMELSAFLDSLGIKHEKTKTIIAPYEIDLYCPEFNIGIEFNGDYWHSSLFLDKSYHYKKSLMAEQKGIRLIQIYEHQWNDPRVRPIIESLLKISFGKVQEKIYARNCEVKEITNSEAYRFNNLNHLQGHRNAQLTYGLFYKNNLVQLMSFTYDERKGWWEIIRGCPGSNNIVIGGVSKLFKHFVREKNPQKVFSYCDFNKFDGKGYEAIGMKCIGYTGPDLNWLLEDKVARRSPSKHKEYKEKSIAKIWGAGSKKYLWLATNNKQ